MPTNQDPFPQFRQWHQQAREAGGMADAMVVATTGEDRLPAARTLLLTGADPEGFRFCTDDRSDTAAQLRTTPYAALVFGWYAAGRQVRVVGAVEPLDAVARAEQFAVVPRADRLAIWACRQSAVVPDRAALEAAYQAVAARWPEPAEVPMPDFWVGYRLRPERYEFWQAGPQGLHDRFRYQRDPDDQRWARRRLAP